MGASCACFPIALPKATNTIVWMVLPTSLLLLTHRWPGVGRMQGVPEVLAWGLAGISISNNAKRLWLSVPSGPTHRPRYGCILCA